MITGIVVALPEELRTLTRQKPSKGQCCRINDRLLVVLSGAGEANAERAAQQLIAQGATQLISWGCAAALREHLKQGDLLLANVLVDTEGSRNTGGEICKAWHKHCLSLLAEHVADIEALTESKCIVETSAEKHRIANQTGAVALDMESIAVARIAQYHQLPFLAIRAIADPVDMDLPQAISQAMNANGEVILARLLRYLVRHPRELPSLVKVGLQFHAAQKTLATVASSLDRLCAFTQPR